MILKAKCKTISHSNITKDTKTFYSVLLEDLNDYTKLYVNCDKSIFDTIKDDTIAIVTIQVTKQKSSTGAYITYLNIKDIEYN